MSLKPSALSLQLVVLIGALLVTAPLGAQTSPYATLPARQIRALSDEEVTQLLEGAGAGFALPAELNGVPGPRHALDLGDQLELDASQRLRLQDVFDRMNRNAREHGAVIVAQERELDALFAGGAATPAEVERRTMEIARHYAIVRASHLVAHIEANAILTPHQVARYAELRGYAAHEGAAGVDHGAHH